MTPEELKEFQESFLKELGITMDTIMEEKLTEKLKVLNADSAKSQEDMKEEIKKLSKSLMKNELKGEGAEEKAKSLIVKVFKNIKKFNVGSEEQFAEIFEKEVKATYQNEGTAGEGAEFVFDLFSRDVYAVFEQFELVKELSALPIKGTSITLPTYDGGTEAYWLDEGGDYTASKATTGNIKVDISKLGALVTFTDEMLSDDMTSQTLYKLIIKEIGVKFAGKIEDAILNGSGKIEGILTNANVKEITSTATAFGDITENDILDADAEIDTKYNINSKNNIVVMLKSTFNKLRQKRDANGVLIFPELRQANKTIFDYRVVLSNKMPEDTSGNAGLLFGNVKDFYYYITRQDFSAEMGMLANDFKSGKKSLRVDQRIGGKVKDGKAFAKVVIE